MSFNEMKALCAQFQGRVATPMNAEENRALKNLVTAEETEGQFVDLTGRRVTYQNWNDGEPNNASPGEHCVMLVSPPFWLSVNSLSEGAWASSPPIPFLISRAHNLVWKTNLCQFHIPRIEVLFCGETETMRRMDWEWWDVEVKSEKRLIVV